MNLQSNIVNDKNSKQVLRDAIDRIKSIALIHDKIYNSKNISHVSTEEYIRSLSDEVIHNFSTEEKVKLDIKSNVDKLELDVLVPMALIINELLTNSLKYGLKDKVGAFIKIHLIESNKGLELVYLDNGQWFDNPDSDHFGTSLIDAFTEQLEGSYSLDKLSDGTKYIFNFRVVFS